MFSLLHFPIESKELWSRKLVDDENGDLAKSIFNFWDEKEDLIKAWVETEEGDEYNLNLPSIKITIKDKVTLWKKKRNTNIIRIHCKFCYILFFLKYIKKLENHYLMK